jgi:predicted DNA-binding protein (MmcQ/YjbR family)
MTIDAIRSICGALPGVTEDVKWGHDLCFCVSGKMFAAMDLNPPHGIGFKCSPEDFGELVERSGIRPAPYLARAMWVQEERLGDALEHIEYERLLRSAYDLVVARLPKGRRPGAGTGSKTPRARRAKARTKPGKRPAKRSRSR